MRVGVVGCGLVAQVMHLPYLWELRDRFDVVALCDLSPAVLRFAGESFPDARRFRDWEDLVAEALDAVLVLTPGSHAPVAIAAAQAGTHAFVEKPMCFSADEGREMVQAAEAGGVRLMVGYMKRYDPAYERLLAALPRELRLVRVTTLESPLEPYVAHYPLVRPDDLPAELVAHLADDDERRIGAAIGSDDPALRRAYRAVLLDSMVHELNAVRGLLGEPDELEWATVWGEPTGVAAAFRFGATEAVFTWVDLPGIARYQGELAFFAADERATLSFPSPFLRSMPTELVREGGVPGSPTSWRAVETVSYEEAFKRELVEFHAAITEDREPRTPGADGLRDVALCQSIVRAVVEERPVASPTDPEQHEARALH